MPITPLPDPPSRSDPATFSARADAFLAALPLFARELSTMTPGESAAALAQAMAAVATHLQGAGLVGFNPALAYTGQTAGRALMAHGLPLSQFSGADRTGTGDSTAAINTAVATAVLRGVPVVIDGVFRYTSSLVIPSNVVLVGTGGLSESASIRSPSTLVKDFDGQGIVFAGDGCQTDGVHYDSVVGRSGDLVQVTGSRWHAPNIAISNAGRDGLRLGADAGSYNTNLWHIGRIITRACGRHGMHVSDPVGSNDVGGGMCLLADMIGHAGDGIRCDHSWWNTFVAAVCQNNGGVGFRITANARATTVLGGDLEGNTGGAQGLLEAGAYSNTIHGGFWGSPACWTDSSGLPGRNVVSFYDPAIGSVVNGSAIVVSNRDAAGSADVNFHADVGADKVVTMRGQRGTGTGGRWSLWTKVNGGSQVERASCDDTGLFRINGPFALSRQTLTWSALMAIDAGAANTFEVDAASSAGFAFSSPINGAADQRITITLRNTTAGALGTATWGTDYRLAAWANPAPGHSRSITFRRMGALWVEESRTPADVPN